MRMCIGHAAGCDEHLIVEMNKQWLRCDYSVRCLSADCLHWIQIVRLHIARIAEIERDSESTSIRLTRRRAERNGSVSFSHIFQFLFTKLYTFEGVDALFHAYPTTARAQAQACLFIFS